MARTASLSPIGVNITLPARLANAGQFTAKRHITEADTAQAKLTHICTRTTADGAAVILTAAELRLASGFDFQ